MTRTRPMIVALTGGLASGKSTVARRFQEHGVPVIDADTVTRRLVEPGTPALAEIVEAFGAGVLDGAGRLDRARMRERIFHDEEDRKRIESILHPRVREAMQAFATSCDAPYVVFVIPLLVETGRVADMDRVIVVDTSRTLQAERAAERDTSPPETIAAILDSQATRADRLAAADIVIENTGDLALLHERVDAVHRECRMLADTRNSMKESCNGRARTGWPDRELAMQASDRGPVIYYEQPLSERIRTLLRLEFLFDRARYLLGQESPWASRLTFEVIIDVMAVLSRADIKKEIIKELERHSATLVALSRNPNVAQERLQEVRDEVHSVLQALHERDTSPGHELRYNELLNAVRQRSSIPAGTCDFDLPAFHYWLEQPAGLRLRDLREWISAFDVFQSSIGICLRIVRESASATREIARGGFFQRNLGSSTPCQMIRVAVPRELALYPEISAGKQRFAIRFLRPGDSTSRPGQTDDDVEFDLLCCVI